MHMSIFKKNSSFFNNYFTIYDKKGIKLKVSILLIILVFIKAVIDPVNYLYIVGVRDNLIQGVDRLYEYTIPLCSLFIIFYVFFEDYKDKTYEFIEFLNTSKHNNIVMFRFFIPMSVIVIGSFISGLIYYRNVSFLDITNIYLSIRFIPNSIFLCSMFLYITTLTKNSYAGILAPTTYIIIDYLTSGHLFKIFSIGGNLYNYYYYKSPSYYFMNRLLIIILGVFFLVMSVRRSSNKKCII